MHSFLSFGFREFSIGATSQLPIQDVLSLYNILVLSLLASLRNVLSVMLCCNLSFYLDVSLKKRKENNVLDSTTILKMPESGCLTNSEMPIQFESKYFKIK